MSYVIEMWRQPSLPVIGSNDRFPVRRIFCLGRNYVEHRKEMGIDGLGELHVSVVAPR